MAESSGSFLRQELTTNQSADAIVAGGVGGAIVVGISDYIVGGPISTDQVIGNYPVGLLEVYGGMLVGAGVGYMAAKSLVYTFHYLRAHRSTRS